jgi:hypothetical protein
LLLWDIGKGVTGTDIAEDRGVCDIGIKRGIDIRLGHVQRYRHTASLVQLSFNH